MSHSDAPQALRPGEPHMFRRTVGGTESKVANEHGNKAGLSTLEFGLYFVFANSSSEEHVS